MLMQDELKKAKELAQQKAADEKIK